MLISAIILAFTIINPDGSVERSNQTYKAHYSSDHRGGYYITDNEGSRGHLSRDFSGNYTYTEKRQGITIIPPANEQRNKR